MTARWLWVVGALLGAQLLKPSAEPPRAPTHARELKRPPIARPR